MERPSPLIETLMSRKMTEVLKISQLYFIAGFGVLDVTCIYMTYLNPSASL